MKQKLRKLSDDHIETLKELYKDFVPYKESLDLKELGFDKPCFGFWDGYNGGSHLFFKPRVKYHWLVKLFTPQPDITSYSQGLLEYKEGDNAVLAPTFSQAFRFFREKYNLRVSFPYWNGYNQMIPEHLRYTYECIIIPENALSISVRCEEAELACLRKLIQIVKEKALLLK